MEKRLYVGNLPYQMMEDQLREIFAQVGEVNSVAIPTDRDTGRSRGFGFVAMADEAAARTAIERLDGTLADGRALRVAEARPRSYSNSNSNSYQFYR